MTTPFQDAVQAIVTAGYHNHRLETHSDVVSDGIFRDLLETCEALRRDYEAGNVVVRRNVGAPGDRRRKVDLFVGEPDAHGEPDMGRLRLAVENKSVITAHRNRTNRFDDLQKVLGAVHAVRPQAILIAMILVGLSDRVLNIPDQVHKFYRDREDAFAREVLPRLSSGDHSLWEQFDWAISRNRPGDPANTIALFRQLPTRPPGHTHMKGYDSVLLIPAWIDNVSPPRLASPDELAIGIDVDAEYRAMLQRTCAAYTSRWHA